MLIPFLNRLLNRFSVGIGSTVMVLMMLSKGSNIETVGLIISVYSISVIIFEFPSGVLADIFGHKKIYLFSIIISIFGYLFVLFSNSLFFLIIGFSLYGIARAFSSGSIETIFINNYKAKNGNDSIHKLISLLNAGEIIGLACGALLGGIIPTFWEKYFTNQNKYNGDLVLQIIIQILLFLFTFLYISELSRKDEDQHPSIVTHIKESFLIVTKSINLKLFFIGTSLWGFCLMSIELYWQPFLQNILGSDCDTWLFGIINSGYFLASLVGVALIGFVLNKIHVSKYLLLFISRFVIGVIIIILSYQNTIIMFSIMYLLLFMVNGISSVPELTILNEMIPDNKRSSILSLSSLILQIGGLLGSVLFSLLLHYINISAIWIITGIIVLISSILYLFVTNSTVITKNVDS